jgi:hypothetical protein
MMRVQRIVWTIAAAAMMAISLSAAPAHAADDHRETVREPRAESPSVAAGMELKAASAYVWRGFVPTPSFSLEPEPWVRIGRVTVSSLTDLARPDGRVQVDEHDLTVDYTQTNGKLIWSAGWINYVFPQETEDRHSDEVYAALQFRSYLHPTLHVYEDVHAGSGTYINLAVSHEYRLGRSDLALTPTLAAGYNHQYWIDDSMFSDANAGVSLTIPTPVSGLRLAPFVNYSRSLHRAYGPSRFYGGLGVVIGAEREVEQ